MHAPPPSGAVPFGRYLLKALIARGGMGEVFEAVAVGPSGFEKPVVVKRVLAAHAGREDLTELFVAEAKLMARLAHPNLVQVIDFGRGDDGAYFLVLELVRGVDLGRFRKAYAARGDQVPVPLALLVVSQALRGLAHAHKRAYDDGTALVHRDVSPGNILLSEVGEVKVADFGVALVAHPGAAHGGARYVAGKPGYMAPEQERGDDVDPRADLFAAGVVLFETLTGELPGDRTRPSALREDVPVEIDAILERALAPERDDRWHDARAMLEAIESLRDRGQRIASGDELAEAVTAVVRATASAAKPVVALSASVATDTLSEGRVLTRVAAPGGDLASFTVKLEALPEAEEERPPAAQARTLPRWGIAVAALAAIAVAASLGRLGAGPASDAPVTSAAPTPSVAAPPEPSPRAPSLSVAQPPPASTSTAALPAPHASHAPAPAGPPPKPPDTDCRGTTHFLSNGSWSVSGGPRAVQTPGTYEWPCGTYSLVARSRLDPGQTRTSTVTVRSGAVARWDLR